MAQPAAKTIHRRARRGVSKVAAKASRVGKAPARHAAKNSGPPMLERFRKEAESLQKQLRTSADRAVRQLEQQFLRQLHAATEDQVKKLERRVAALEKTVKEYDRRVRALGVI